MKRIPLLFLTFNLIGGIAGAQTAPVQAPTVQAKTTNSESDLKAQFAQAETLIKAAKPGTQERGTAEQNAAVLAAKIAWAAFDAGQFDDAATWFDRRATLRQQCYQSFRAAYKTQSLQSEATVKTQIAKSKTETTKQQWRGIGLSMQGLVLTQLQILAREYHDAPTLLEVAKQKLAHAQAGLATAKLAKKPADILAKTIDVVKAMDDIGSAQADLALFEEAKKNYLAAQAIRRSLPAGTPGRELHESSTSLALLASLQGDLAESRRLYLEALSQRKADAALRAKSLENEKNETVKYLAITSDAVGEGMILNNLGKLASDSGDYKAAQAFYDQALQSSEKIPKEGIAVPFGLQMRAITRANIAAAHADQGFIEQARSEMEAVIKDQRAMGAEEDSATSLANLSGLLYEKGDLATSQRYLEQARKIAVSAQDLPKVVSFTLSMASLMNKMERLPEAERLASEGIVLARKSGNWSLNGQAARTMATIRLSQKRPADAQALLVEASVADNRVGAPLDKAYTLELQGRVREASNDLPGAIELYKQSVTIQESVRATASSESAFAGLKNNYTVYESLIQALIKTGRGEEAFDYMNRSRSRQLQESLRVDSIKTGNKALQALLERVGSLEIRTRTIEAQLQTEQAKPDGQRDQTKIRNLQGAVASSRGEWRKVVEQIKTADPSYEKLFTVKPLVLSETQRSIPTDSAFVMYVPIKAADSNEEQLYIFLVTKESLKIFTPNVKTIDLWTRIRAVRRQIALRQDDTFSRGLKGSALTSVVGRGPAVKELDSKAPVDPNEPSLSANLVALYDILITPIEAEIASKKTLAFIPTQLLYYLPIQALAKRQGDDLRFLIEDKEIVYLTGADVMKVVQTPDSGKSQGGLMAFGNPTGANLPNADQEVKTIAQIFPASTSFSGPQVTKAAVTDEKNLDRRVVHFATHGMLDSTTPAHSYILLSPGQTAGEEQLTIGEVWDLPLQKVDLVALSACDTALGERDPNGTEITTLAEAFSSAGASTVLASLWSVADDSTKDLMVEFYKQLAAGKSKSAALREAEISVMKNPKYRHPYFWAPFILMGDWR